MPVSFDVTIVDDVPQAVADTAAAAEDTAVTYNVITNANGTSDLQGADAPATLTAATLATAGAGTVGFLANGAITFTPAAGLRALRSSTTRSPTRTATLDLDADGHACGGFAPVVSTTNLTVDEDGFPRGGDTLTARTDETDSTESLTATGTAVVNFGSDVPANLLGSIVLVDTPALDGQLQTHDGQSVTFALDGSGDLVGSAGATEVIRIHLVSAAAGPGAGDVTYTYSTTLSQPLEHADGALENAITLTGVTVQVTDSDSDTLPVSFDVTIVDDVPQANNDGTFTVAEGTPLRSPPRWLTICRRRWRWLWRRALR